MRVLVFGNPALPDDSLALEVGKRLGQEVTHLEDPLQLLGTPLDDAVILDVAEGVEEPMLIAPDRLSLGRLCSLHDFDMAFFLTLLRRIGEAGEPRIIALPMRAKAGEVLPKVKEILHNL